MTTTKRCIECDALIDLDSEESRDAHRLGESGDYLCPACWRRLEHERLAYLASLRQELAGATAGRTFYRRIVGVEPTEDEYVCHHRECHRLVASDCGDPNPVWLVASHHGGIRRCCTLRCCLAYAEDDGP